MINDILFVKNSSLYDILVVEYVLVFICIFIKTFRMILIALLMFGDSKNSYKISNSKFPSP